MMLWQCFCDKVLYLHFNMKYLFVFCVAFIGSLSAQDLRGRWVNEFMSGHDRDEMTLDTKKGNNYSGTSFDRDLSGGFCKFTFQAKYDPETTYFLGKDVDTIERTQSHTSVVYKLKYYKKEGKEYLDGLGQAVYSDGSLGSPFRARYTRPIEIKKQVSEQDKAIVKSYKSQRRNPTKANLKLKRKDIKIKVHDYGKEDHDSISIIYNDELIAYKIPIDSQSKEYDLEVETGQNNQLTFIAHNLGDVAPNTTYVEILADNKVFKYTLFTDMKKNAVINIRLQE